MAKTKKKLKKKFRQRLALLEKLTKALLRRRGSEMASVNETLEQLSTALGELAKMVVTNTEAVVRIDQSVNTLTTSHQQAATKQTELQSAHNTLRSNHDALKSAHEQAQVADNQHAERMANIWKGINESLEKIRGVVKKC